MIIRVKVWCSLYEYLCWDNPSGHMFNIVNPNRRIVRQVDVFAGNAANRFADWIMRFNLTYNFVA